MCAWTGLCQTRVLLSCVPSKHGISRPSHQQLSNTSFGPQMCCLDYLSAIPPSALFHVSFFSEQATFARNLPVSSNTPVRAQPYFTEAASSQKTAAVTSPGFHTSQRLQIFCCCCMVFSPLEFLCFKGRCRKGNFCPFYFRSQSS